MPASYVERAIGVPGAVLWRKTADTARPGRILPDGCLDVIFDGKRLFVAGPDSAARIHEAPGCTTFVGVRFANGIGPTLLGVPADELVDTTPVLADLWGAADARVLAEQVAADPVTALRDWAMRRAETAEPDPWGSRVFAMARAGWPVGAMADRLGLSARQFHRRCLPVFGYGPRRLARVLRLEQALGQARAGVPLAVVAAERGYADQAHLTREVRALTGLTPTALLRESLPG